MGRLPVLPASQSGDEEGQGQKTSLVVFCLLKQSTAQLGSSVLCILGWLPLVPR